MNRFSLGVENKKADAGRDGTVASNPSCETKSSGANGDREILRINFPFSADNELTTSRIGNLTRLILTFAICDDHTSILYITLCR